MQEINVAYKKLTSQQSILQNGKKTDDKKDQSKQQNWQPNNQQKVEEIYQEALRKKVNGQSESDFRGAAVFFRSIDGYKDSSLLAKECDDLAMKANLKARQEKYQKALYKKNNGQSESDFREAAVLFRSIDGYKDSSLLAKECDDLAMKAHFQVSSDADREEAEIKAIEDILRSKASTRIKKQKISNQQGRFSKRPRKHRIVPIVVVSGIVLATLIFVVAAFFLGVFDNSSSSLGITVDEFSAAYAQTDAYKAIASYGFEFPAVTLDQEAAATSDVRTFSGIAVDNTVDYPVALSGSVNKSDSNIQALRVVMRLSTSTSFKEVLIVYAPYIQVLYPDMTTKEATTFLSELYTSTDAVTVRGNYGLAMEKGNAGTKAYCSLNIISAND